MRRTKIVCTLGPSTDKEDKLYSLRQNIFVLNPEIGNLVTQIYELKKEIEIKEGKENNAE